MSRPVFLLSLPRAGSTLLQRLLLGSGKCASVGEPSLLLRFLGEGPVMTRKATYWESLVEKARGDLRAEWSGFDAAYREGVRELMMRIYDGLAGEKEWFVDKTPRYALIAEEIMQVFPDAKFIVLWRHPLAVAASMCATYREGRWCPEEFGIDLHEGLDRLVAFRDAHRERVCELRYEDLVADPAGELKRVGEYLGWDGLEKVADGELVDSAGGSMGDPTGVKKYGEVSEESRDAWKGAYGNWYRRGWAEGYFSGERAKRMGEMGYGMPDDSGKGGGLLEGMGDWVFAKRRVARRVKRPTWLPRLAKEFREERGWDVTFR